MAQVGRLGPNVGSHLALLCIHRMNRVNTHMMLGSAERGKVRLISRKITFQEFQPIQPRYLNVTDRQTDGRTDNLPWQYVPRSA